MYTFLPYPDFELSVKALDDEALYVANVSSLRLIEDLLIRHQDSDRAAQMWAGFEVALLHYLLAAHGELRMRGHVDDNVKRGMAMFVESELATYAPGALGENLVVLIPSREDPPWLGWDELHHSHQSALLRIMPERYEQLFPDVPDDLPLVWP